MTATNRFCTREHDDYLAAVAVHLLREREDKYPRAIEAGQITASDAARKLELMRCIAAQWHWIADPARPPCPAEDAAGAVFGAPNWQLALELDAAADRARQLSTKAPSADAETFAELVAALAWSQRDRDGSAVASRVVDDVAFDRAALHRRRATADHRAAA